MEQALDPKTIQLKRAMSAPRYGSASYRDPKDNRNLRGDGKRKKKRKSFFKFMN
jgi:hypothetical protein